MNKLANMRHWPERMSPANFGMSRPNTMGMPGINPHQQQQKTAIHPGAPPISAPQALDTPIHYSFNVPFASDLAGPDTEDIVHATADAVLRWTHPEDAPDDVAIFELPIHALNLEKLRKMCRDITQSPLGIEAYVQATTPKNARGQVINVCLSGSPELVYKSRETILNETPISLVRSPEPQHSPVLISWLNFARFPQRCTTVDVDGDLFCDLTAGVLKENVIGVLDDISKFCGVDIFLLGPKLTPLVDGMNGDVELRRDQRWRVAIYGDLLSSEHAKTRVLIHIDKLVRLVLVSESDLTCGSLAHILSDISLDESWMPSR